jgi:hypothetical protein
MFIESEDLEAEETVLENANKDFAEYSVLELAKIAICVTAKIRIKKRALRKRRRRGNRKAEQLHGKEMSLTITLTPKPRGISCRI